MTGVRTARPVVDTVQTAEEVAEGHGHIAILPGDPEATRWLRELLGNPAAAPDEDALVILAVRTRADLAAGAAALARARHRNPDQALAVVVGSRAEREQLERELIERHGLEASNVAHVAALDEAGAEAVVDRIIDILGTEKAVAQGRRYPALRPAVGRRIVRAAARQSAAIGAVPLGGAAMPVLTLLQIKMVGQLATLYGRPMDAERIALALSVFGAGFGWRALGRTAVGHVPGPGWAIHGGLAYGVTRALGEANLARLEAGHRLVEGRLLDAVKPKIEGVLSRLSRNQ
jgi:uncharacterized protein (DUF697 family)